VDGAATLARLAAALGGDPEAVGASRSHPVKGKTSGWGTVVYAPRTSLLLEVWDRSGQVVYRGSEYERRMLRERGHARTARGSLRRTILGGLVALWVVGSLLVLLGGWLLVVLSAGLSMLVHVASEANRGSLAEEAAVVLPFLLFLALSTVLRLVSGPSRGGSIPSTCGSRAGSRGRRWRCSTRWRARARSACDPTVPAPRPSVLVSGASLGDASSGLSPRSRTEPCRFGRFPRRETGFTAAAPVADRTSVRARELGNPSRNPGCVRESGRNLVSPSQRPPDSIVLCEHSN
jgi:hypothetical protein